MATGDQPRVKFNALTPTGPDSLLLPQNQTRRGTSKKEIP
jgi:hypothetical protein